MNPLSERSRFFCKRSRFMQWYQKKYGLDVGKKKKGAQKEEKQDCKQSAKGLMKALQICCLILFADCCLLFCFCRVFCGFFADFFGFLG